MIPTASPAEAAQAQALHRGHVLDVRNPDEFAAGHVPGALAMPLHVVPLRSSELIRSQTYYVICESGGRSAHACAHLGQQGVDARSVVGGMAAWRAAGLPVEPGMREQVQR